MRELKFRAWDITRKHMLKSNCVNLIMFFDGQVNEIDCNGSFPETDLQKDKIIMMQFTGLKDKNGKEIYEGDIVKAEHTNYHAEDEEEPVYIPWIGEVVHDNCMYLIKREDYTPSLTNIMIPSIEVLGNIYENPELLK